MTPTQCTFWCIGARALALSLARSLFLSLCVHALSKGGIHTLSRLERTGGVLRHKQSWSPLKANPSVTRKRRRSGGPTVVVRCAALRFPMVLICGALWCSVVCGLQRLAWRCAVVLLFLPPNSWVQLWGGLFDLHGHPPCQLCCE